jgi:hypothetical protein
VFQGDGDFLTFCEGQMGIAYFLVCARLEHNGITTDEVMVTPS